MENEQENITPNKTPKVAKGVFKDLIRLLSGWIVGLLLFVLIVLLWVLNYGEQLLKEELVKLVDKQTKGLYTLTIEKADVNWLATSFTFQNISLEVNQKERQLLSLKRQEANKVFTKLRVKEIELRNISLWAYLWHKKVDLEEVFINAPDIFIEHLHTDPNKKDKAKTLITSLAKTIRPYLSGINLKKLNIREAGFKYETQLDKENILTHELDKVNIKFNNIDINTLSSEVKQIIKLGGLEADLGAYTFGLGEIIYQAKMDKMKISSKDSSLQITNLHFAPKSIKKNKETYKTLNADVLIENFLLSKIDFKKLLYESKLIIGNFKTENLIANISLDRTIPKKQKLIKLSANEFLGQLPFYIKIKQYQLLNAKVNYEEQFVNASLGTSVSYHRADSIFIELQHLALGLASFENKQATPLYSDKIVLQFQNYEHLTSDGMYQLNLDKGFVSSKDSVLRIQHGSLSPLTSKKEFARKKFFQTMQINATVEDLYCHKIDIEKLVYTQIFSMGKLTIKDADFKTYLDATKPKQATTDVHNFEEFLHQIPLAIKVDTLQVNNANVLHEEFIQTKNGFGIAQHKGDNINLQAMNINLGKALSQSEQTLAELDTKNVLFSMENYHFNSPDKYYKMQFERLFFSAKEERLRVDSLKILPQITMVDIVSQNLNIPSIFQIKVANVEAKKINYQKLILKQEFDFGSLDIRRPNIKIIHNIGLEKGSASDQDTLDTGLQVFHETSDDTTDTTYYLKSHKDYRKMFANLPYYIKVGEFVLQDATIDYQEILDSKNLDSISYHKAQNVNVLVPQVLLGRACQEAKNNFFYADNVVLSLEKYHFKSRDNQYELSFTNATTDISKSILRIESLRLKPYKTQKEYIASSQYRKTYVDGRLSNILINDIDVERLIFDRELVVNKLAFNSPTLALYTDKRKPKNPNRKFNDLEDAFKAIPIYIRVDTFLLNNAKLLNNSRVYSQHSTGLASHIAKNIDVKIYDLNMGKGVVDYFSCEEMFGTVKNYSFKLPNDLYQIRLGEADLSIREKYFQVKDLKIEPLVSNLVFDSLVKYRTPYLQQVSVEQVNFKEVDFLKLWADEGLIMQKIEIKAPDLQVVLNNALPLKENKKYKKIQEIFKSISNQIKVDTLEITNAKLSYTEDIPYSRSSMQWTQEIENLNANFYHVLIDTNNTKSQSKILYADNFDFELNNYATQNQDYAFKIGAMQGNTSDKTFSIENFEVKPHKKRSTFFDYKKYQTDMFEVRVKKAKAYEVDYKRMFFNKEVVVQKLFLEGSKMDIYRDKGLVRDSTKFPKMPNRVVQSIPFYLKVDSIEVYEFDIVYSEKVPKGVGIGSIELSKMEGLIRNFCSRGDTGSITKMQAYGYLMNRGRLAMQMDIKLLSPILFCKYKANLGSMKASFFNKMTTSNEHIKIKKGEIEQARYHAEMHENIIHGSLSAAYRNLKIQVLKSNNVKKKGLLTFFANLIIKNRKKIKRRRTPKMNVTYEHQPYEGFITFIWKALATGLLKTLK